MRISTLIALMVATCATPVFATTADFTGSSNGTFANPQPTGTTTTGVGTNSFTFGDGTGFGTGPSSLTFTNGTFSGVLNTPFKVGSLSFFNGTVGQGTFPSSVDLSLALAFASPISRTVTQAFTLGLESTPNIGTADENADYVYLPTTFGNSTYTINGQSYRLQLTGFRNVIGDGFLNSNASELHVRESGRASADLFATVSAVPEPASWAMMIVGVGAVGGSLRRRQKVTMRLADA